MQKIKKCPFCGAKEDENLLEVRKYFIKFDVDAIYSAIQYAVFCSSCKCIGPYSVVPDYRYSEKTKEERVEVAKKNAINFWNARVGGR